MENLLGKVSELLEKEDAIYLQDDEGNLHQIDEALNRGIKGTPVRRSAKDELYMLLFGKKERIGEREIRQLDDMVDKVKSYIVSNLSPAARARIGKSIAGQE